MKSILAVLLIIISISGCSSSDSNEMKRFKTEEEAINYGIKEEGIKKENIIGKAEQNHETFVFLKEEEKEGIDVSLANIIKKDKQYAWDRIGASSLIKHNNGSPSPEVSWEFETQSKKKFTVYSGTTTNQKISIETKSGQTVEPKVDKDSGIYFYIESSK